jgi:alpha-galactosidase
MEKICPDAWVLQAGNPVFSGTTLMTRETSIKVCGLCHGHYGYARVASTLGLDPDRVTWQAPGLNHNIWLTHFYYEGQDAYPLLDEWIANEAEPFWDELTQKGEEIPTQMSRSAIQQYKLFGLMPIGDTPRRGGWWYHTDLETRKRWYSPSGGGDTPKGRDLILKRKDDRLAQMKEAAYDSNVRPIDLFGDKKTREQHIPIIDALVNDHEGQFQVNVPNHGALEGVPDDVAVEVPAVVNKKGIQPLCVGSLPPKIMLEQIYPDWLNMERTLEALKSGDKSMLLWGILNSHQTRSYEQALQMLEALLAMEPNEPMHYIEDINDHYKWPDIW